MTLTFLDLYNECAGQPWSMYDAEASGIEDLETALKISINKAVSYLWNFQPWSFRKQQMTIRTVQNRAEYELPNGLIYKKTIGNVQRYSVKYDNKYLTYAPDYELLDIREGEPEEFYVDGDSLFIYPTPDKTYAISLTYLLLPYGLNKDNEEIYELKEEDDYINIPEKYEVIFKNCLISLAMIYAIADESDENHSGYLKQYEDALNILLEYCKNGLIDRRIVW